MLQPVNSTAVCIYSLPTRGAAKVVVSEGAVLLLKAERGIFICIEFLLLIGVYTPAVFTVARVLLVACATGCVVETACTARVVPIEQPALAGEFL